MTRFWLAAAAAIFGIQTAAAQGDAAADRKVLRMVPHSNLVILDPVWTTAYMSRNHGYMIYEQIEDTPGSGPYIFKRGEFESGEVYIVF